MGSLSALNIVHVCRIGWPSRGGMESSVQGLSAALRSRGHHVRVVTLRRSVADASLLPRGSNRGVEYTRLRRVGPRRYPFAVGLRSAVRGADVVHVHGLDGLVDTLAWAGCSAPVVVSTHGGYFHTSRHGALKRLWSGWFTPASLARVQAVWFSSEADQARLPGCVGRVLEGGHELGALLAQTRTPEVGLWVIPGRVVPHKGHESVIRAVAALASSGGDRRLVAVGACPDRRHAARLDHLADRLGVDWTRTGLVSLPGYQSWLARAEQVVCPSRSEGFGLALLEAMAAGVPISARDIPSHRRLLGDAVVELSSPLQLLTPADGEQARERARAWDWSARVEYFERGYRQVMG